MVVANKRNVALAIVVAAVVTLIFVLPMVDLLPLTVPHGKILAAVLLAISAMLPLTWASGFRVSMPQSEERLSPDLINLSCARRC